MDSFILGHGLVCTLGSRDPRAIPDGGVYVVGDEIRAVGTFAEVSAQAPAGTRVVDAKGRMVLPGFICAHGHYYGLFSRGMSLHDDTPANFLEILERLWWRLDRALDLETSALSAEALTVNALLAGTTTIIDHHASPCAIAGSLDAMAAATKRLGARAAFCYEVTDRNGLQGAKEGIQENVRFAKRCAHDKDPLLAAMFGMHASFTICDETMHECVEEVKRLRAEGIEIGFHVHAAEGEADEEDCLAKHGCRVVARLEREGVLGPHTVVGHGVHADASELAALRRTRTALVINPESNMNNAVGLPVPSALFGGEPELLVGLGTDGMTYDMLQELKACALALRQSAGDALQGGAGDAARLLFRGNSLIASRVFQKPVGRLEPGCFADLITLDYRSPTPVEAGALPWHLQFGASSADVRDVFVGGKQVVAESKLLTADPAEVAARCRAATPKVWGAVAALAEKEKAQRVAAAAK